MPSKLSQLIRSAPKVRWLVILIMIALIIATALWVAGTAFWGWKLGPDLGHADRATRTNTVAALGAFALVAAALFVALIGYLAATGPPGLEARVMFRFSAVNEPVLLSEATGLGQMRRIKTDKPHEKQAQCFVYLVNHSRYSARNPGVRVKLDEISGMQPQPGWAVFDELGNLNLGPTLFQWDGGADQVIHGNWTRPLPILDFGNAEADPVHFPPSLTVTVVADGVRPATQRIPVRILDSKEFVAYLSERNARIIEASRASGERTTRGTISAWRRRQAGR